MLDSIFQILQQRHLLDSSQIKLEASEPKIQQEQEQQQEQQQQQPQQQSHS